MLGHTVEVWHDSAMIASIRPIEDVSVWTYLITQGAFSPLNNVESLMFPDEASCTLEDLGSNDLKESWDLALQTLGWGRDIAQRGGASPILWRASMSNAFLRDGY